MAESEGQDSKLWGYVPSFERQEFGDPEVDREVQVGI